MRQIGKTIQCPQNWSSTKTVYLDCLAQPIFATCEGSPLPRHRIVDDGIVGHWVTRSLSLSCSRHGHKKRCCRRTTRPTVNAFFCQTSDAVSRFTIPTLSKQKFDALLYVCRSETDPLQGSWRNYVHWDRPMWLTIWGKTNCHLKPYRRQWYRTAYTD